MLGRMRRFLPRKTGIAKIDETLFNSIMAAYNKTPGCSLDWKTPAEAFSNQLLHFKREITSPLSRDDIGT